MRLDAARQFPGPAVATNQPDGKVSLITVAPGAVQLFDSDTGLPVGPRMEPGPRNAVWGEVMRDGNEYVVRAGEKSVLKISSRRRAAKLISDAAELLQRQPQSGRQGACVGSRVREHSAQESPAVGMVQPGGDGAVAGQDNLLLIHRSLPWFRFRVVDGGA